MDRRIHNPDEHVGERYGSWVLVRYVGRIRRATIYEARCEKCGGIKQVKIGNLRRRTQRPSRQCLSCAARLREIQRRVHAMVKWRRTVMRWHRQSVQPTVRYRDAVVKLFDAVARLRSAD